MYELLFLIAPLEMLLHSRAFPPYSLPFFSPVFTSFPRSFSSLSPSVISSASHVQAHCKLNKSRQSCSGYFPSPNTHFTDRSERLAQRYSECRRRQNSGLAAFPDSSASFLLTLIFLLFLLLSTSLWTFPLP